MNLVENITAKEVSSDIPYSGIAISAGFPGKNEIVDGDVDMRIADLTKDLPKGRPL